MHLLVFHELHRMRVNREMELTKIVPEKNVLLEKSGIPRQGSFDFFAETTGKTIGFEVLTRPTQGKLREKLCYAQRVDEFVFVLPKDAFELYKKSCKKGRDCARPNFFGKEFKNPKLKAWLIDLAKQKIIIKAGFEKIFNVK